MVDLGRAVAPQLLLVSLQEAGKLEGGDGSCRR